MQAQAYEGYFENGRFYIAGQTIQIPERQRVVITVFNEPITDNRHAIAWQEFLAGIKKIENEPVPEFERVKFNEVDL